MKTGDKLVCKSNKMFFGSYDIGHIYEIILIYMNCVEITDSLGGSWYFYFEKIDVNAEKSLDNMSKSKMYIWDYFYTPKELRKMKLEKLEKC